MLSNTPPQVSERHLRRKLSALYERRVVIDQLIRSLQAYQKFDSPRPPSAKAAVKPALLEVRTPV